MNKQNYINLAKKSASLQISELKKIKKVFNQSFVKAIDLILNFLAVFTRLLLFLSTKIILFIFLFFLNDGI